MSTNEKEVGKFSAKKKVPGFKAIDAGVVTVTVNQAVTPGQEGTIAHVLHVYGGLKPLLVALSAVPLIPKLWQEAMKLFVAALDALAAGVSPDFKAGKDL